MDTWDKFKSQYQDGNVANQPREGGTQRRKPAQSTPNVIGIRPLEEVRTTKLPRNHGTSALSMLGFYLGGISGGFSISEIPEMKRDPDVSVGLEYLLTPILNAKVTVQGVAEEQIKAQEIFDRFWQHDLECFKDMFSYGYCPAEVRYKRSESDPLIVSNPNEDDFDEVPGEKSASRQQSDTQNDIEYDGMIPLEPTKCEPYVTDGKLAYIKVDGKIKLESHTEKRPAKGFWLANDPTYSPLYGNSVLPGAWLFWRAKIGMPDSAVEVLLKANYKAAFSGLEVRYPSEDISDDDGNIYDARAEAEWYAENVKAGTNVVLPSETDENGKPKWEIKSYGGQPIDIQKMLPLMEWLTKQIHRGIGVVDDVITKEGNVGSYSRSNVSRQMFLMLALRRARRIAHTFDQMVCRPLMKRNGYAGTYKIDVKIPGMEDEDPNGSGMFGQNNQFGGGDEQNGANNPAANLEDQGQEAGPLAKLFQQAMAEEEGNGESGEESAKNGEKSGSKEMSLNGFIRSQQNSVMLPTGKE